MLVLSDEENKYVNANVAKCTPVNIRGKNYFVKRHFLKVLYSEIIAEKVAKLIGMNVAHNEAIKIDGIIYNLSEDLNSIGKLSLASEIKFRYLNELENKLKPENDPSKKSLYGWWQILEFYYPNDVASLMKELIQVYFFDILMMNPDRCEENWGIVETPDGPHIYIFDNEYILNTYEAFLRSSYDYEGELLNWGEELPINLLNFLYFLLTSSSEYIELIINMLDLITPEEFSKILAEVEFETQDKIYNKDKCLNDFRDNYDKIKELIEKRGKNGERVH